MSDLPKTVDLEVLDRIRDDAFHRGVRAGVWLASAVWIALWWAALYYNFLTWSGT